MAQSSLVRSGKEAFAPIANALINTNPLACAIRATRNASDFFEANPPVKSLTPQHTTAARLNPVETNCDETNMRVSDRAYHPSESTVLQPSSSLLNVPPPRLTSSPPDITDSSHDLAPHKWPSGPE